MAIIQIPRNNVRIWRKGNSCALLVETQVGTATTEYSTEVPQKIKNISTIWCSNFASVEAKKMKTLIQKDICTPKFIAALFIKGKRLNKLNFN